MDEQLGLLIQLQEIDGRIRSLSEQKKRLPAVLADLEERRTASKARLERATEALQAAQKNKRDRDKDLEDGAQRVEKLKARTSEIKTNKEYQALLKEIEAAEQENKSVEDSILVLMEQIEAASAEINEAEQRSRDEEAAIRAEQEQHEAEFARLGKDLNELERARQELASSIQPAVLVKYENLLSTKAGVALAEARGEACSGCYMSIPPQVFVNVKKNDTIISCPQCGRILFYKEAIVPSGS